jgi:hypothetical protein
MSHSQAATRTFRPVAVSGWKADLLAALAAALAMVAIQVAGGLPTLYDSRGDNDSLMRLVQIRDWLGGQAWSDLHQDRMGPSGGFLMHWSRIVDVPVAAITLLVAALTGSAALGEAAAAVLWPALLFAAALFLLLRISRALYGQEPFLPVLLISAITLNYMGIFTPRALDHHNLQLVMALAATALLLEPGWRPAALAGLCAALMLAIGLETLPYVAVIGLFVAGTFLVAGAPMTQTAAGFGTGFAASGLAVLLASVPVQSWWSETCDAYSAGLAIVAMAAGLGLAGAAGLCGHRGAAGRAAALAVVGLGVGAVALLLVPQCFGDPYAGLDPRLRSYWLDDVIEAQPLWGVLAKKPEMAPQHYVTALLALLLLGRELAGRGLSRGKVLLAVVLAAAVAVSIWQVRGSTFSLPFAVVPLAAWVAGWRRAAAAGLPGASARMAIAWLVSLNMTWSAAAFGLAGLLRPQAEGPSQSLLAGASAGAGDRKCYADAVYPALAAMPATTVLAISNLGTSILANTHHRVLAGPYHRNVAGNLLMMDAFMGAPDEARVLLRENGVGLVALCVGNGESRSLADWGPSGLMASLLAGHVPDWLERLPGDEGAPLAVYRVR